MPNYFIERFRAWCPIIMFALFVARQFSTSAATFTIGSNDLIVTDSHNSNGQGAILDINPATGQQQVLASGGTIGVPNGLCFDLNGDIIVTDFGHTDAGAIVRIDRHTLQQSVISSGRSLAHPTGVALAPDGQLLVTQAGANLTSGALLRIDPQTGSQSIIATGLGVPEDVAVSHDGTIYVDSFQTPAALLQIDPISGSITTISSLLTGAHGMSLDKFTSNRALVADSSTLDAINLVTGVRSTLSSGFSTADDVAQDNFGNTYVSDYYGGSIVEVNLATGAKAAVVSGGFIQTPGSILIVPEPSMVGLVMLAVPALLRRCRK